MDTSDSLKNKTRNEDSKGLKMDTIDCNMLYTPIPSIFMVETVLGCNLRCPGCAVGGNEITRKKGLMSFEQYKIIADKMRPFAKTVYLVVWGEPLLNGDIFRIIRYTSTFAQTITSTNGMLINKENAQKLIESGIHSIVVSIDGTTQEVYEKYRVGGSLSQAFNALALLNNENIRQGKKTNIVPQFIVFKHNQHQMEGFKTHCNSMGLVPSFKAPYFISNSPYSNSDFTEYTRRSFLDEQSRREAMRECRDPKDVMTIFLDGSVVPCCHARDADVCFGNIFDQELLDIWNSNRYQKFRNNHKQGNISHCCLENCMDFVSSLGAQEKIRAAHEIPAPFMNANEIEAIQICLKSFGGSLRALEWGSGNSSLFFSAQLPQGSSWTAIEHDQDWFHEIKAALAKQPSSCLSLTHVKPDKPFDGLTDGDYATFRQYILLPVSMGCRFDFILVDGRARVECMAIGWSLLKEKGVMALHDAQRHEYDAGIPKDCFWVRIINPDVIVEKPVSILFVSKSSTVIDSLQEIFHNRLAKNINVQSNVGRLTSATFVQDMDVQSQMTWDKLQIIDKKLLYAGDVPARKEYSGWIGLSLTQHNESHIQHDITLPFPLPDNSVDSFQAEDVLEHIPYEQIESTINEIYRILKPGALFRLSVPDYGCDVLQQRSEKDKSGKIIFDPYGGGTPENPGHVWFPKIDLVRNLIQKTAFNLQGTVDYLHFYNSDGSFVVKPVDYSKGYVDRTPDHDERVKFPYRPMSMIIDLIKCGTSPEETPLIHMNKPHCEDNITEKTGHFGNSTCIFINTYYQAFLDSMYSKIPELHTQSYNKQMLTLQSQYFGDSDFYSNGLKKSGWNADDLIVNCDHLQQAWAREQSISGDNFAVLLEQLKNTKSDVIYLQNLGLGTSEFFAAIRPYTNLTVGQIAYPLSSQTDLKGFDIIFSSFPHFVDRFRSAGITAYYQPLAFEPRILDSLTKFAYDKRPIECSFVGGISPMHGKGYLLLESLAANVPIHFWGYGAETLLPDSSIRPRHHGEVWGREMFYLLGASKITINRHIDVAENYANNMRLFEATGCGALLITDYKENLNELFEIGKEVIAYRSPEECIELVKYYLANTNEAEKIAKAGQARTLRDHTYEKRMRQTAMILSRHLRYQREQDSLKIPKRISDSYRTLELDEVTPELESAWKNPDIPLQQRALVQQQLREMYQGNIAQPFRVLIELLLPLANEDLTVLEIGCASGYYYEVLEYLLKKQVTYTGVDYSEVMIDLARNYYPDAHFFAADGSNLPFADASFRVVISGCVLLHVPNYIQHIAETCRVAEKWIVVHRTPICRIHPTSYSSKMAYGIETVELRFNEHELLGHFEQHGFKLNKALTYLELVQNDEYEVSYLLERVPQHSVKKPSSLIRPSSSAYGSNNPVVLVSRAIAYTFPLSYAYLAGQLRAQGEDVRILFKDVPAQALVKQIMDLNPLIVGFGNLYPELAETRILIRMLDEACRKFPIVIGGQMVSPIPEFAVRITGADYGIIGEGELVLAELVKRLRSGSDVSDIKGLVIREGHEVKNNGPGPYIEDLSSGLPAVPYDLFPTDQWLPIGAWYVKNNPQPQWKLEDRVINVHGGRGCPFTCNFCYHHSKPRYRDISAMMEEAQEALIRFDGNMLYFSDDLVMATPKRAHQLIEAIAKLDRPISFSISTRFDILSRMNDELLRDLKRVGCRNMGLGLESGSDRILEIIGKNCTAHEIEEGLERLRLVGIYPASAIMVGQYTETLDDVAASIALMQRSIKKDPCLSLAFTLATPFPGSQLHSLIFEKGLLKDEQEFYDRYFAAPGEWKQIVNLSAMADNEVTAAYFEMQRLYDEEKRKSNVLLTV